MEVQLNGQLKVGGIETYGLKKRVEQESYFSEKQSGEITRLGGEISRLNSEKDALTKELQDLRSAPPLTAAPQATYHLPSSGGYWCATGAAVRVPDLISGTNAWTL